MKKLFLLVVCLFLTYTTFAQNKEKALEIVFSRIDTSYFTEDNFRYNEFTMSYKKANRVMDLLESDTTLPVCDVLRTNKEYRKYLKKDGVKMQGKKYVVAHLVCEVDGYFMMMWIYQGYAHGIITAVEKI